jgi:hypothetical protein
MRSIGVVSAFVLLLTWLALDDITTDSAQRFDVEYTLLALSGIWFAGIGAWLVARRQTVLGSATLAAVVVGIAAFWSLPHRGEQASAINYAGFAPLLWCLALIGWMLVAPRTEERSS